MLHVIETEQAADDRVGTMLVNGHGERFHVGRQLPQGFVGRQVSDTRCAVPIQCDVECLHGRRMMRRCVVIVIVFHAFVEYAIVGESTLQMEKQKQNIIVEYRSFHSIEKRMQTLNSLADDRHEAYAD